jgi:superfamily II DNA/RNA helicase
MGFHTATPIQEQAIPSILKGKDLIATAQTGTGKTAAFLIPVMHLILQQKTAARIKALIIVPTRELAIQIDQQLQGLSYFTGLSSLAVYGGTGGDVFSTEKRALTEGADIIIGTPGRLIAHLNMDYVKVEGLQFLILDEADRMLDMGFYEDIMNIVSYLPEKRQNLLFSATMPPKIQEMAGKIMEAHEVLNIAVSKPPDQVLQVAYVVHDKQKLALTKHLLQGDRLRSILVFCSTKSSAKLLSSTLSQSGLNAADIHSDLTQEERGNVLNRFKSRQLTILVATDILSRGIDVEDIDLVINYDVPQDGEDYVHRIGRTARASSEGMAITLVGNREQGSFSKIEDLLGKPVFKAPLPAEIGKGPIYKPGPIRDKKQKRHFRRRK